MSYEVRKGIACCGSEEIFVVQNYFIEPGPSEIPVLTKGDFEEYRLTIFSLLLNREKTSQRPEGETFPLFGMNNMCVKQVGQ